MAYNKKILLALAGLLFVFILVGSAKASTSDYEPSPDKIKGQEPFDFDIKNDYNVEWYKFSTLTKSKWIIAIQNLDSSNRDFNLSLLIDNANIDLNKINNIELEEWKNISYSSSLVTFLNITIYPQYNESNATCSSFGFSDHNTTNCLTTDEVFNSTVATTEWNVEWKKTQNRLAKEQDNQKVNDHYGEINIPKANSKIKAETFNGTKYFRLQFHKPIENQENGFGSSIDLSIESEGFNYHPVDLALCTNSLDITIDENNGTNFTSMVFNGSFGIVLDSSAWTLTQYVVVDNQSTSPTELEFNVSEPITARSRWFINGNLSADLPRTIKIYFDGASCTGDEVNIQGYDSRFAINSTDDVQAYAVINDGGFKNAVNGKGFRLGGNANTAGFGVFNTKGIDLDGTDDFFCIDEANTTSGTIQQNGITLEFWIKPDSLWNDAGGRKDIAGISDSGAANKLLIDYDRVAGKLSADWQGATSGTISSAALSLLQDRWYHIAATHGDNTFKLYLDGILQAEGTFNGAMGGDVDRLFFGGKVDACTGGAVENDNDAQFDEIRFTHAVLEPLDFAFRPNASLISNGTVVAQNNNPLFALLDTPVNNSNLTDTTPLLQWLNSTDPDVPATLTYDLTVYNETESVYVNLSIAEGVNFTNMTIAPALLDGIYFWGVNVSDGTDVNVSANRTFTIDTTPPDNPIIHPQNITYKANSTLQQLNFSVKDKLVTHSQHSFNLGANVSTNDNTTFIGNVGSSNTIYLYTNDTAGNLNESSVSFHINNIMILANFSVDKSTIAERQTIIIDVDAIDPEGNISNVTIQVSTPAGVVNHTTSDLSPGDTFQLVLEGNRTDLVGTYNVNAFMGYDFHDEALNVSNLSFMVTGSSGGGSGIAASGGGGGGGSSAITISNVTGLPDITRIDRLVFFFFQDKILFQEGITLNKVVEECKIDNNFNCLFEDNFVGLERSIVRPKGFFETIEANLTIFLEGGEVITIDPVKLSIYNLGFSFEFGVGAITDDPGQTIKIPLLAIVAVVLLISGFFLIKSKKRKNFWSQVKFFKSIK